MKKTNNGERKNAMSVGGVAKKIVELETVNRHLTAALKSRENLSGIFRAILSVIGNPEYYKREELQTLFVNIQDAVSEALDSVTRETKILNGNESPDTMKLGEYDVFPLARCREVYESLKDSNQALDILKIDLRLNELTDFISNVSRPAMSLKEDLMGLRIRIGERINEKAPAAVPAAAEA